jgi:hypothetical protein
MNISNIIKSKAFLVTVCVLFGCSILIGAFGVGQLVGYRKAKFSYAWSEQYDQNFGGPRRGIFGAPGEAVFPNPYGVSGTVINIQSGTIIVVGPDRREKSVIVDAQLQQPKIGDHIVIIGEPNEQGQIVAKFIRILPN